MRERRGEREAWTRFVDGGEAVRGNKYGAERTGKYASKHEASVASSLATLERAGKIRSLREQHRITLVPGDGKLRPVIYVADFTYLDQNDQLHVVDAKGFKTPIYRLKKRMAALLLHIKIEEV
jgi:hypothetical protein